MRERVFPRVVWMLLLSCAIFVLLVILQFTQRGNFSQRIGEMQISGRYNLSAGMEAAEGLPDRRSLDGRVTIFFGGLEFRLDSPESIAVAGDEAAFTLHSGLELSFGTFNSGEAAQYSGIPELRIHGKFTDAVSSINIPFKTQRSSVIRDSGNDTFSISYNGNRYQFSPLQSLETGQLALRADSPSILYQVISEEKKEEGAFNPADFTIPQAETAEIFSDTLARWNDYQFDWWGRNMAVQTDEDTVAAWCGEALRQGRYRSALSAVPVSFSSNPQRSWGSSVYQFDRRIGVWRNLALEFGRSEREKTSRISRLLADQDTGLFTENHLLEFLAIRGNEPLIENLLDFVSGLDPSAVTLAMSPGILELYSDMNTWRPRPAVTVSFEPLTEKICRLTAEALHRSEDQTFVFSDGRADLAFNIRLGKALSEWGEQSGNDMWAGIGRSLILSVIALDNESSMIPVSLELETGGTFTASANQMSTASVYRLLDNNEYLPHARATGMNGMWAWTAASSVNITQDERFMNIAIRFPVGETHYVMLRNIRPFALMQIYGQNWRSASDFESYYNSSGWYYIQQEQTLIIKVSHRSNVENIRIYFTLPPGQAPVTPPPDGLPQP